MWVVFGEVGLAIPETRAAELEDWAKKKLLDPKGPQSTLAQEFDIQSIPVFWLVDRQGELRYLNGREDQERKVERLLKEH
jgi:thioredoxin-related protein